MYCTPNPYRICAWWTYRLRLIWLSYKIFLFCFLLYEWEIDMFFLQTRKMIKGDIKKTITFQMIEIQRAKMNENYVMHNVYMKIKKKIQNKSRKKVEVESNVIVQCCFSCWWFCRFVFLLIFFSEITQVKKKHK